MADGTPVQWENTAANKTAPTQWAYPPTACIITLSVTLPFLAVVATLLRFLARRLQRLALCADDWLTVPAATAVVGMGTALIVGNVGHGITSAPAEDSLENFGIEPVYLNTPPDAHLGTQIAEAAALLQTLALGLTKLSLLFFYCRIFRFGSALRQGYKERGRYAGLKSYNDNIVDTRNRNSGTGSTSSFAIGSGGLNTAYAAINAVLIIIVVLWTVAFFLAELLKCGTHLSALWTPDSQSMCVDLPQLDMACALSDLTLYICVLVLPIPRVWALNIHWRRKLEISAVFGIGCLALAASIVRALAAQQETASNPSGSPAVYPFTTSTTSWLLSWSLAEASLSSITTSLPTLRYLVSSNGRAAVRASLKRCCRLTDSEKPPEGSDGEKPRTQFWRPESIVSFETALRESRILGARQSRRIQQSPRTQQSPRVQQSFQTPITSPKSNMSPKPPRQPCNSPKTATSSPTDSFTTPRTLHGPLETIGSPRAQVTRYELYTPLPEDYRRQEQRHTASKKARARLDIQTSAAEADTRADTEAEDLVSPLTPQRTPEFLRRQNTTRTIATTVHGDVEVSPIQEQSEWQLWLKRKPLPPLDRRAMRSMSRKPLPSLRRKPLPALDGTRGAIGMSGVGGIRETNGVKGKNGLKHSKTQADHSSGVTTTTVAGAGEYHNDSDATERALGHGCWRLPDTAQRMPPRAMHAPLRMEIKRDMECGYGVSSEFGLGDSSWFVSRSTTTSTKSTGYERGVDKDE